MKNTKQKIYLRRLQRRYNVAINRSYYAIIPASVRYDNRLIPSAKLLYGEITALSNERGYCWASNDYFAQLYGVSKTTIKSWLKSLEDNGHINRRVRYRPGTKEIEIRWISICTPRQENLPTPVGKPADPRQENLPTPRSEICPDSTTSFNNTNNNTNKEVETSPVKYSTEHFTLASKLKNNLLNDFPKEMKKANLEKWADVIRLMEEKDDRTIKQIEYVINWLPSSEFWFGNIRSAKKLREKFDNLKFEIKKETSNQKRMKKPFIREEPLPERFVNPEPEPEIAPERQAEINAKVQAYLNKKGGD